MVGRGSTGEMIGIWRLVAFGLVVLVRYVGQEMEANHRQIRVVKEEDEGMKIRPSPEPLTCWKRVIRGRNTTLEDWFQRLNKFILLKFIVPIFSLFSKKLVAIVLLLLFAYGNRFFTLIEGSARFDIVSGGQIYCFSNSCIKLVWWLAIRIAPLGVVVSMSNRRAKSSSWKVKVVVSSGHFEIVVTILILVISI